MPSFNDLCKSLKQYLQNPTGFSTSAAISSSLDIPVKEKKREFHYKYKIGEIIQIAGSNYHPANIGVVTGYYEGCYHVEFFNGTSFNCNDEWMVLP